jgi:hypothetical protein
MRKTLYRKKAGMDPIHKAIQRNTKQIKAPGHMSQKNITIKTPLINTLIK